MTIKDTYIQGVDDCNLKDFLKEKIIKIISEDQLDILELMDRLKTLFNFSTGFLHSGEEKSIIGRVIEELVNKDKVVDINAKGKYFNKILNKTKNQEEVIYKLSSSDLDAVKYFQIYLKDLLGFEPSTEQVFAHIFKIMHKHVNMGMMFRMNHPMSNSNQQLDNRSWVGNPLPTSPGMAPNQHNNPNYSEHSNWKPQQPFNTPKQKK